MARGAKNKWLTPAEKERIHKLYKNEGILQGALAERFGVTPSYISMVIKDQEQRANV